MLRERTLRTRPIKTGRQANGKGACPCDYKGAGRPNGRESMREPCGPQARVTAYLRIQSPLLRLNQLPAFKRLKISAA